jgi:2,3-bisphosphoglycerate-independent phosphoglycerate mutase
MRYVLVVIEGAADTPQGAAAPRTPLAASRARHAARLAVEGRGGLCKTPRDAVEYRGELVLASWLGIEDKERRSLARGPLEALGDDLPVRTGDVVYRANFVTLDGDRLSDGAVRLTPDERSALVRPLQEACQDLDVEFHPVGGGRMLVVFHHAHHGFPLGVAPSLLEGESIDRHLPGSRANPRLRECLDRCRSVLAGSSVNAVRVDLGENPASALWLWGGGPPARVERPFAGENLGGFMLTNSALAGGLARACGMSTLPFRSPTENAGPGPVFHLPDLVEALRRETFGAVYIQAPREGGRYGGFREKTMAVEAIDFHVLGPFLSVLESFRPFRLLLASDLAVGAHSGRPEDTPTPFILSGAEVEADEVRHWDEDACALGAEGKRECDDLFPLLFSR